MLELKNIEKKFGGNLVLQGISFSLEPGRITGLIGPNGAGKTTLFNVITGFHKDHSGTVIFSGDKITGLNPEDICKKGICRTFQVTKPFANITLTQNVMIGALSRLERIKDARRKAQEILDFVGLYEKREILGRNLTIADRKKLEIARGLATSPKIFLLDEVMAGLNESELLEMKKLIRNIADSGITLFIIEHIMTVIMELSQKVIVLDQGKFLTSGTPEQVTKNPEVIKAYLGKEFKHA